ncbi:hypothetical protein V3C99_018350 [Haemonchus contortus]|uniref:Reverse transcriptase domain-containing protein n=1 Tax=Haemonchus contortus TaxID=6289 RepID=A0A7I4Z2R5_HAECO
MGQRLAPRLAIAFVAKIETPILERVSLMYCRYIDGCFVVCATQEEIDKCFDLINRQSELIKLTREKPSESWLFFLKCRSSLWGATLSQSDIGSPATKIYYNSSLASAHPRQTERGVIRSMFQTATNFSTGEDEKKESVEVAQKITELNGYKCPPHSHRSTRAGSSNVPRKGVPNGKIPFMIPFISDKVSASMRRCLKRSGVEITVGLVDIPPNT